MSDFGTMVLIYRVDGTSTTPADEGLIKQFAEELAAPLNDRINEFSDFNLAFGGSDRYPDSEGVMISLTEYWVGDEEGNDGLDDEAIIQRDTPQAERFAELLRERLGADFEIQVYCGDW